MEIERKFLIFIQNTLDLDKYQREEIEQSYLSKTPVVRIRKINRNNKAKYYITIKGKGLLAREEVEFEIPEYQYQKLSNLTITKNIIKTRFLIPYQKYTLELDHFKAPIDLWLCEVEFSSIEEANSFIYPSWFIKDVTMDEEYSNVRIVQDK